MNPIQLGIIVLVGVLIIILIGYFWYQEIKFKRLVERNFNQKTEDVISHEQTFVLDGIDINKKDNKNKNILAKDIFANNDEKIVVNQLFNEKKNDKSINLEENISIKKPTLQEEIFPDDSVEAIFANIKKIAFPFNDKIDFLLDYIVNIAFEEPIKIKVLPDVASYTQKQFKIYVLDDNNNWSIYERGNKYHIRALRVVIHLIDKNGIMNQAQVANVYNELFKFTMLHSGFIEQSDFEASIMKIREQLKHLIDVKLDLELYLIFKTPTDYKALANFFMSNNFTEIGGKFNFIQDDVTQFIISDEHNQGLQKGVNYNLLKIVSNLHFVPNPSLVIENVLDMSEKFMRQFESRLLTTNKQVFNEREYNTLTKYIDSYMNSAKKYGIILGGELIRRLL